MILLKQGGRLIQDLDRERNFVLGLKKKNQIEQKHPTLIDHRFFRLQVRGGLTGASDAWLYSSSGKATASPRSAPPVLLVELSA